MRLLIESAVIFFGTLMAAALVALGAPAVVDLVTGQATPSQAATPVLASNQPREIEATSALRPGR